jgi:hypothetical protein
MALKRALRYVSSVKMSFNAFLNVMQSGRDTCR